jgi:hypothetical protein
MISAILIQQTMVHTMKLPNEWKARVLLCVTALACSSPLTLAATQTHQRRSSERVHQTITFGVIPAQQEKSAIRFTATASSNLPVHSFSMTPAACAVTDAAVSLLVGGTCVIEANQAGDRKFAPAPIASQILKIEPSKTSGLFDVVRDGVLLTQTNLSRRPTAAPSSGCPFPTIRSLSPATWIAGGTYQVTITGTGFRAPGISTADSPVPWITVRADSKSAILLNATILNSTTILATVAVGTDSPEEVADVVLWYPPPKDEDDPALPLVPEH